MTNAKTWNVTAAKKTKKGTYTVKLIMYMTRSESKEYKLISKAVNATLKVK